MAKGYAGRYLRVDLTEGRFSHFTVEESLLRKFIGGSALGAKLYLDGYSLDADPLAPETPLMVMTGPLVGSGFPGSSRFAVCAKSPLTGIWGESACGGTFGPELKKAGYDGIVITGRSASPVCLSIVDGEARLSDASGLWGKDVYETTNLLREADKGAKALVIGPAGENLVRFAAIGNDKAHYVGRTGLGAVMGAKNLKAICVRGSGKLEKADEARFREIHREAVREIKESALAGSLHAMGSDANMDIGMINGDVPIRNWTIGEDFELSSALSGPTLSETYLTRTHACANCPVACKRVVRVPDGPHRTEEGPGPEYETCATFGTMIMNRDLAGVIKANELCNRYGMDTISCGAAIAWAMELYEKGLLTPQTTDGLDLTWGNMEAVLALLPRIARREGFGGLLAEGTLAAARKIGSEAVDAVVHVKGLDLPMHDPRGFHGMGLAYMMSNRGACHLQHAVLATEQGMASWPQLFPMKDDYQGTTSEGKAELVFHSENYGILGNSLSICHYLTDCLRPETIRDAFNAVTGFNFSFEELMRCGMRDWTLKRGINNLLGVTAKDDALPKRILTPLKEGAGAGSVPDVERLKREYYAIRGLDERGFPKEEKLRELGLDDLRERLYRK
ncbi:MAG: aldehyde ferredoxin oxidoreductase family protein [Proteobacteria bacterium]|nr:aldehyde ferredoxin oxidoreductase family protein [Pseudomonadota bacterium]MBU2262190.1 aldehyde ferredoxin oxidoreductase family protein [Pseudomonadota bacterium]